MIHWSHSQEELYRKCTRSWFISTHKKQLGVWVPTPYYFVYGGLLHEIMWRFKFAYDGEAKPETEEALRLQWEEKFTKKLAELEREIQFASGSRGSSYLQKETRRNFEQFERRRQKGLFMLIKHYRKAPELQIPWLREQKFAIHLGAGGSVKFWVVLDRLFKNGRVEDVKTGKDVRVNDSMKRQLLGYRGAAQVRYAFPWLGESIIFYLPKHEFLPVKLRKPDWEKLRSEITLHALLAQESLRELKKGSALDAIFRYHPDMKVCQRCRFYFPCRVQGLTIQHTLFSLSDWYGVGRRTVAIEPSFVG